jgi:hypothetical protein
MSSNYPDGGAIFCLVPVSGFRNNFLELSMFSLSQRYELAIVMTFTQDGVSTGK